MLIEGPSEETPLLWEARMAGQAPEIDGVCYVNDFNDGPAPRRGEIRRMRISEAHDYDLVGGLVDSPEAEAPEFPIGPFRILAAPRAQTAPLAR